MKRIVMFMLMAAIIPATIAFSQPSEFDRQLSGLRKNIIAVCGKLQAAGPETVPAQMAAAVDSIITGWSSLKGSFQDNPPQIYANDPAWKGYFTEAADNFSLMKSRASEGNYKRAVQFCGLNCALFVKIHQVNGVETVTDRLFSLRQAIMTAKAMVSAGNNSGAVSLLKKHIPSFDKMPLASGEEKEKVNQDIASLKKGYKALTSTVAKQNKDVSMKEYNGYLKTFNQIYADNI